MPLQPLRIPTGWKINFNILDDADPKSFIDQESENRWSFTEDLLQLEKENLIVDLGWYPEGKLDGNYLLVLIENENWEEPVFRIQSRDKTIIIYELEKLLNMSKFTCPCCGYKTLDEKPPGTYLICKICFWEDDIVQFNDADFWGGANKVSLRKGQLNFLEFGACEERCKQFVRKPNNDDIRDSNWKLVDEK
jgi:hypothetical protein